MKSQKNKPLLTIKKGGEISLAKESLTELLHAVLEKGASLRFRARGFSMSPFIKDNDLVTVSPLGGKRPGIGDVVSFLHPTTGRLAIHRVVGKKGGFYLLKGDNAVDADDLVMRANILGYVAKVERKRKRIFLGFGPEKYLIALLNRTGLFSEMLLLGRSLRPFIKKKG